MGRTLYEKVWEAHEVRKLQNGQSQLFIDLHLLHEVSSPQAFGMLKDLGLRVRYPHRTFATVDHIVPTHDRTDPFQDPWPRPCWRPSERTPRSTAYPSLT